MIDGQKTERWLSEQNRILTDLTKDAIAWRDDKCLEHFRVQEEQQEIKSEAERGSAHALAVDLHERIIERISATDEPSELKASVIAQLQALDLSATPLEANELFAAMALHKEASLISKTFEATPSPRNKLKLYAYGRSVLPQVSKLAKDELRVDRVPGPLVAAHNAFLKLAIDQGGTKPSARLIEQASEELNEQIKEAFASRALGWRDVVAFIAGNLIKWTHLGVSLKVLIIYLKTLFDGFCAATLPLKHVA